MKKTFSSHGLRQNGLINNNSSAHIVHHSAFQAFDFVQLSHYWDKMHNLRFWRIQV